MKAIIDTKTRNAHEAFWRMEPVEEPLIRLRKFTPLRRGGNYGSATKRFENNERIDPSRIGDRTLLQPEPSQLMQGDLIIGSDLPGLCWSEGFLGCRVAMGEGGVWADSFLSWPGEVRGFVDNATKGISDWIDALERGTRKLVARASGRYPITQPLLRGPIDMMTSAIGHANAAIAFIDDPSLAGEFLDLCTDRFIEIAESHLSSVAPFDDGYVLYGIWSSKRIVRTQLDNAVLFSPAMYAEHFLPRDRRVFEHFDRALIHVHSGSLHIAEHLAAAPALDAVQISLDMPAGPTLEEIVEPLKLIQERKPIVITGAATEGAVEILRRELSPRGLCLDLELTRD